MKYLQIITLSSSTVKSSVLTLSYSSSLFSRAQMLSHFSLSYPHPSISTYPTYKKGSSHWTYLPTSSNHAYSKVDMFAISKPHCLYIPNPANSSSTYPTLKQKISRAAYPTIVLSMLPHWKSTICCLSSTAIQLDYSILKYATIPYISRVYATFQLC